MVKFKPTHRYFDRALSKLKAHFYHVHRGQNKKWDINKDFLYDTNQYLTLKILKFIASITKNSQSKLK